MKWAIFCYIMLRATVLQFPKGLSEPQNICLYLYIYKYIYKYSSKSYPSNH